ncbi:MAG: hypothetical protein ACOYBK_02265 [Bilifractor sp.]
MQNVNVCIPCGTRRGSCRYTFGKPSAKADITGFSAEVDITGSSAKADITGSSAKTDLTGSSAKVDLTGPSAKTARTGHAEDQEQRKSEYDFYSGREYRACFRPFLCYGKSTENQRFV